MYQVTRVRVVLEIYNNRNMMKLWGNEIMSTNIVGRLPVAIPQFASLHDADNLYEMARDKSPEARKRLIQTVAAVLQVEVSSRESELIADILIELLHQAEKDLREALSRQLAILENVPLRLVLQMANDDVEVARHMLSQSPILGEFDLMYIIKSKTAGYWQAIAERKILSDQIIDTLADTGDFDTALALANNMSIKLTSHAVVALSDLAQESEVLSTPLLRRDEVPAEIAMKLYEFVGQELKEFIKGKYQANSDIVSKAVDGAVQEFRVESAAKSEFYPEQYMVDAARGFAAKGLLTVPLMLKTLRSGHMRSFVAQFSVYTDIPVAIAEDVVMQSTGQKLALVCKGRGVARSDFVSMFLLTGKLRERGQTASMDEVSRAVIFYDKTDPELAMNTLSEKLH